MRPRIGLIAASGAGQSFLARLPAVRDRLGPVYAPSIRIATRIVNTLRSGSATVSMSGLSACRTVFVAVPNERLVSALAAAVAEGFWRSKTVILCASSLDSEALGPLRKLGAHCASLDAVPGTSESRFVAEGDKLAISELRRLLGRANLLVLQPRRKGSYQAGLLFATDLVLELTANAVQSLRAAGLSRPQAVNVVETLVSQTARAYGKAGRRATSGLPSEDALAGFAASLRLHDLRLAKLFQNALALLEK